MLGDSRVSLSAQAHGTPMCAPMARGILAQTKVSGRIGAATRAPYRLSKALQAKENIMPDLALDPVDLAALLCSRVCHDIISPVGAIINGLEVLEEDNDAEMRGLALDLIKKSAAQASARLQFCRLAFGARSSGASIDLSEAEGVARGFFKGERAELKWNAPALAASRAEIKLVLNLCLIAAMAIPRGGVIEVTVSAGEERRRIAVSAKGANAKLAEHLPHLLSGTPGRIPSTPNDVQAYYAALVASSADMALTVAEDAGRVTIEAGPLRITAAQPKPVASFGDGDGLAVGTRA